MEWNILIGLQCDQSDFSLLTFMRRWLSVETHTPRDFLTAQRLLFQTTKRKRHEAEEKKKKKLLLFFVLVHLFPLKPPGQFVLLTAIWSFCSFTFCAGRNLCYHRSFHSKLTTSYPVLSALHPPIKSLVIYSVRALGYSSRGPGVIFGSWMSSDCQQMSWF